MSDNTVPDNGKTDVVLVGAGIMSATLGALLRLVEPSWSITLVERLDAAAAESSDPWNNAGTGHSALCELNYTPQNPDGSIDKYDDLPAKYQANLNTDPPFGGKPGDKPALDDAEIDDVVAFLGTLTDGYFDP